MCDIQLSSSKVFAFHAATDEHRFTGWPIVPAGRVWVSAAVERAGQSNATKADAGNKNTGLGTAIFKEIKEDGGLVVNYLTDETKNPIHWRRSFPRNFCHYDHIFITKPLWRRLEKDGTAFNSWLSFA